MSEKGQPNFDSYYSSGENITGIKGIAQNLVNSQVGSLLNTTSESSSLSLPSSNSEAETMDSIRQTIEQITIPVMCLLGVLGNTVTVHILMKELKFRKLGQLETSSHRFLIALGISDLMFCLCAFPTMGTDLYGVYTNSETTDFSIIFSVYFPAVINIFIFTSTWLLVAMIGERAYALSYPFQAKRHIKRHKTLIVIAVIFFVSVFINIPVFWRYRADPCSRHNATIPYILKNQPKFQNILSKNPENITQYISAHLGELLPCYVVIDQESPWGHKGDEIHALFWTIFGNFIPLFILFISTIIILRRLRKAQGRPGIRSLGENETTMSSMRSGFSRMVAIIGRTASSRRATLEKDEILTPISVGNSLSSSSQLITSLKVKGITEDSLSNVNESLVDENKDETPANNKAIQNSRASNPQRSQKVRFSIATAATANVIGDYNPNPSPRSMESTATIPDSKPDPKPRLRRIMSNQLQRKRSQSARMTSITLVALSTCFLVFVSPSEIARLLVDAHRNHDHERINQISWTITTLFNLTQTLNFCMNFFLLTIVNKVFRQTLVQVGRCSLGKQSPINSPFEASTAILSTNTFTYNTPVSKTQIHSQMIKKRPESITLAQDQSNGRFKPRAGTAAKCSLLTNKHYGSQSNVSKSSQLSSTAAGYYTKKRNSFHQF